jgi:hypothetical protein
MAERSTRLEKFLKKTISSLRFFSIIFVFLLILIAFFIKTNIIFPAIEGGGSGFTYPTPPGVPRDAIPTGNCTRLVSGGYCQTWCGGGGGSCEAQGIFGDPCSLYSVYLAPECEFRRTQIPDCATPSEPQKCIIWTQVVKAWRKEKDYQCSTADKLQANAKGTVTGQVLSQGTRKEGYLAWGNGAYDPNLGYYCYSGSFYKVCCNPDGTVAPSVKYPVQDGYWPEEGWCGGKTWKRIYSDSETEIPVGQEHPRCKGGLVTCEVSPLNPQEGNTLKFTASTSIANPTFRWKNCQGFSCNLCSGTTCTINNAKAGIYQATVEVLSGNLVVASTTCYAAVGKTTYEPPEPPKIECNGNFGVSAGLCNLSISLVATGTKIRTYYKDGEKRYAVDPDDSFQVKYYVKFSGVTREYSCDQKTLYSWCDEPPFEESYPAGCNRSGVECGYNKLGRTVFCEGITTKTIKNEALCYEDGKKNYVNLRGVNFSVKDPALGYTQTKSWTSNMRRDTSDSDIIATGTINVTINKKGVFEAEISASAQNQPNFDGWSGECLNDICPQGDNNCSCTKTGTTTVAGKEYDVYKCTIEKETDKQTRTASCKISLYSRAVDLVPQPPEVRKISQIYIPSPTPTKFSLKDYIAGQPYEVIGKVIQNIKNNFENVTDIKELLQGGGGYYESGVFGLRGNVSAESTLENRNSGSGWEIRTQFTPDKAGQYSFQTWHRGNDEFLTPPEEETSGVTTITVYRYLCYNGFCWECPSEPQRIGTVLKVKEAGCRVVDDAFCKYVGYPTKGSCKGKGRE